MAYRHLPNTCILQQYDRAISLIPLYSSFQTSLTDPKENIRTSLYTLHFEWLICVKSRCVRHLGRGFFGCCCFFFYSEMFKCSERKERTKEKKNPSAFVVSRTVRPDSSFLSCILRCYFILKEGVLFARFFFFSPCVMSLLWEKRVLECILSTEARLCLLMSSWRSVSDWTEPVQGHESSSLDGWHSSFLIFSMALKRAKWAPWKGNDAPSQVQSIRISHSSNHERRVEK